MLRRSGRRTQDKLLKEQKEVLEARLSVDNDDSLGLEVTLIENKGRGVKVLFNIIEYILKIFVERL